MAQQKTAVLQGDARRPESVQTFVRESVEDSYGAADLYSTLSLILGLISFTLKLQWKSLAWASFIFCGASFARMRNNAWDIRHQSVSIMFASMAIVGAYANYDEPPAALTEAVAAAVDPSASG